MKTLGVNKIATLFFMLVGGTATYGQNQPEVPGDQFSLEGALELFKKSASPEEFEQLLNSPKEKVNNLDLNGDGYIDYVRVTDRNEGNVHAFILSAVISETETQDIAVISLEKLANGKAVLQIIGDADIYGIETIIEPTQEVRINAGASTAQTVVNVWAWPSVQYVYSPYYSGWVSPWHWRYRPIWWSPWRPIAYVDYYPYWGSYRPYYSICHTHRIVYAQNLYRPYRNTSLVVYNRHHTQISHYRSTRGNEYGRTRYDDGRSGRQNNGGNRSDDNERGRTISDNRDTRPAFNDRQTDESRRGSSVIREESVIRNRTNQEVKRGQRISQQGSSTSEWRNPNIENRRSSSEVQDESILRSRTQEVKREQPIQQHNREVQRQDTRERSPDTNNQRSAPQVQQQQPQRANPSVQPSGSGGASGRKRGRD